MGAIDDLRSLSVGDAVRVMTATGDAFTLRVADEVDYVAPDEYGAGHLEVSVVFDDDVHDVPSDELPREAGKVVARRESADALGPPALSVLSPFLEEHTGSWVEEWETLGRVGSVEVVDGRASG